MKTKNAYRLAQHLAYGDLNMFLAKAGGWGGGGDDEQNLYSWGT